MATLHIDGKSFEVDGNNNLLATCINLGIDLPYFCWHPALGSVGACRQCAVTQYKDENDRRGRIVMACMTKASDCHRIGVNDEQSRAFRAAVIEWLMTNHPHDCPVCEEGGECHLQDMTVMTGHTYRRYHFAKRTFRNQYLGPFINHEMNRCITCYRCVRFYRDYAGGHDLQAFASKNHVYFGRLQDGALKNPFSGNLVEICPTGVFTDKVFSDRYSRKWDLQGAPSLCHHCSLGCNIIGDERDGELRRVINRYHDDINGYFICDRGRFGTAYVNSDRRLRYAVTRDIRYGPAIRTTKARALRRAAELMSNDRRVIGIGSPTASLESNFALRELVGAAHFFAGVSSFDHTLTMRIREVLSTGAARAASLRDAERADAVLVLGEDISNTAPRLALSLRQAVRGPAWELADKLGISHWNDYVVRDAARALQSPLFIASAMATSLDDIATATWRGAPDDLARLGFAVAHAINAKIPTVAGLTSEERDFAEVVAASMKHAERPLVVAGSGCNSRAIIEAAANVAWSLNGAKLCYAVPECNSMGLAAMASGDLETAVAMLQEGPAATVVVLENDLYRRADSDIVDKIFARAAGVIAIDYVNHATIKRADVVLPTSTFAEAAGTLINNEGRAQRFFQVLAPAGDIQESWRWLGQLAEARGIDGWRNLDDVIIACANRMPTLAGIIEAAPLSDFRIHGMRVNRQPHRFSGRTAIHANVSVHEPQPPQDADAPMSFSMEGYSDKPPAAVVPFYWAPGWNSVQALNKFQAEVGGPLRGGDAGVRLIEPSPDARPPFFTPIVMPFSPRPDELWIVPCHHLFGSDPLSVLTPGIAARAPKPYLMVHPEEMRDFTSGERVTLMLGAITLQLTLELQTDMPRGVAGLPVGLPGIPFVAIPAWGRVRKEASP